MATKAYMLALPVEMVQHIACYVNATDLLLLRLTCKQLGAAIFDAFAAEFLHELTCYVMMPTRLHRLQRIACSPHLAAKILALTLCMDVWEGKDAECIQTAPRRYHVPKRLDYGKADAMRRGQHETYFMERRHSHALYHSRKPNLTALDTALQALNPDTTRVCIDIRSEHHDSDYYELFGHDVLNAFQRANYPIHDLRIDEQTVIHLQRLLRCPQPRLVDITNQLKRVRLELQPSVLIDRGTPSIVDTAKDVIASAETLDYLGLRLRKVPDLLCHHPILKNIAAHLLLANSLSSLREMHLWAIRISLPLLLEGLTRCRGTLEKLDLVYVNLISIEEQWSHVVRHLLGMTKLDELMIVNPYQCPEGTSFRVQVNSASQSMKPSLLNVRGEDRVTIRDELQSISQRGLVLTR